MAEVADAAGEAEVAFVAEVVGEVGVEAADEPEVVCAGGVVDEPAGCDVEPPIEELPRAGLVVLVEPELAAVLVGPECDVEVTEETAWLTAEVTGAAAWVTVDTACDTGVEAWSAGASAAEPVEAGLVTVDTTLLTVLVTPLTTPLTVLVTESTRLPVGFGVVDAGAETAARLMVAAWALDPDRSQKTAIRPKQQPASTRPRVAVRPAPLWPADPHASGTAYSTPV